MSQCCSTNTFFKLFNLLINSSFSFKSSKHLLSPIVRAREIHFQENVNHLAQECAPFVTSHVSHVSCQMWSVTCHMSHILIIRYCYVFDKLVEIVSGEYVINEAYFVELKWTVKQEKRKDSVVLLLLIPWFYILLCHK